MPMIRRMLYQVLGKSRQILFNVADVQAHYILNAYALVQLQLDKPAINLYLHRECLKLGQSALGTSLTF